MAYSSNEVTVWGRPEERLNSEYGIVTYQEWCEKECVRVGDGTTISTDENGLICVTRPRQVKGGSDG